MVNTYTQAINPIRSDIWLPFRDQFTTDAGIKSTSSFGGQTEIQTIQLGDGTTSSTYPSMIGSKGFRFKGFEYLNTNSLTLSDTFSIGMLIRPKLYGVDSYICSFSNGGGINVLDTASSNELTYYDGTTRISSGVVLEKERFYFVIVTKDEDNEVSFYINGDLEGFGIGTDTGFDLDYVGCDDSVGNFYIGELREFFVFSETLVGVQIGELNAKLFRNIEEQDIYVPTVSDPLSDAELAGWDGLQVWLDPLNTSDLTMAPDPVIANADFEIGDPPTNWTPADGTTSAYTADPYAGSQSLLLTSAAINSRAYQSAFIIGNRYVMHAYGRGDGSNGVPYITIGSGGPQVNGTNATSWQYLSVEGTSEHAFAYLRGDATVGTGYYVAFDDVASENLSITSIAPRAGALTSSFSQATATAQPWKDSTTGAIRFDGGADIIVSGSSSSDYRFLHDGTGATIIMAVDISSFSNMHELLSTTFIGASATGTTFIITIDGSLRLYTYNGATAAFISQSSNGIITTGKAVLAAELNASGSYIWKNGVLVGSDTTITGALDSGNPASTARLGKYGFVPINGTMNETLVFNRSLSATEKTRLRNKLAAKWGITLP